MSKSTRQQAIVDIVSKQSIPNQAVLSEELRKLEFEVTQATLSRDIAELNLVKSKDGYRLPENAGGIEGSPIPDPVGALRRLIVKVDDVQNLLVIRTRRSSAQQVGMVIDNNAMFNKVVGTIAGDDTVLAITRSTEDALDLKKIIVELVD